MMRSLFSGVSGLRVHQTKMDVIANNIANVNTVGFKASRVVFSEVFYQRLQGASGTNAETGRAGTNPMQIGLGAGVATIDNLMSQGFSQRTDNATDVMIQGSGFFVVSDVSGVYFTRAGNVNQDGNYNLHINGMQLMGWDAVKNENTGQYEVHSGPVQPLSLSGDKQYVPPAATTLVDMIGNLNANEDTTVTRTMDFYDSVGNMYSVDVVFTYHPGYDWDGTNYVDKSGTVLNPQPTVPVSDHANSYWDFKFATYGSNDPVDLQGLVKAYPDNDRSNPKAIAINVGGTGALTAGGATGPAVGGGFTGTVNDFIPSGVLRFNDQGMLTGFGQFNPAETDPAKIISGMTDLSSVTSNAVPRIDLIMAPVNVLDPTATFGVPSNNISVTYTDGASNSPVMPAGIITMDFSDLHQYVGEHTNAKLMYVDGNTPGTLMDISIGTDGKITGRYSNGQTRLLAQIPVAQFTNPAGLEKVGNNLFVSTNNSGQFDGTGDVGDIMGGTLEMSNVDLSQEFTDMITTQRGFQANSRIISTSDDMLQELVNLKR